jgi:hypothetical protein
MLLLPNILGDKSAHAKPSYAFRNTRVARRARFDPVSNPSNT